MEKIVSQRLATVRNKLVKLTNMIDELDPENPIHAYHRGQLVKARTAYQRQEEILLRDDDDRE